EPGLARPRHLMKRGPSLRGSIWICSGTQKEGRKLVMRILGCQQERIGSRFGFRRVGGSSRSGSRATTTSTPREQRLIQVRAQFQKRFDSVDPAFARREQESCEAAVRSHV